MGCQQVVMGDLCLLRWWILVYYNRNASCKCWLQVNLRVINYDVMEIMDHVDLGSVNNPSCGIAMEDTWW